MTASGLAQASDRRSTLLLGLVGLTLVVITAAGPLLHHRLGGIAHWAVVAVTAAGAVWAAFAADRNDARTALVVIVAAAVAMRLLQLGLEPYLSDDIYRYVWDGRVQAAGINPYRYIPTSPELSHLRDADIFPRINRADYAPTIYPPTAQMFFLAVTRLGESVLVMKLALVACEGVAIAATLVLLARLGLPATRIAAVAWHPLPVWEIAGSGHVDALMVAGVMLAMVMLAGGRKLLAGAIAMAAALVKPTALLVLPVLWRPWRILLPTLVIVTGVVLYLPYLSVGWRVLGFLPVYLDEEGLKQGAGFRYLAMFDSLIVKVPHGTSVYVTAFGLIMLGLAFAAAFRRDRSIAGSVRALAILLTVFLMLLTPHYPWYYLVLVPFLAFYRWSWTLWVLTVGGMQTYQAIPDDPLPDYFMRQYVFHTLALVALVHDVAWARRNPDLLSNGVKQP